MTHISSIGTNSHQKDNNKNALKPPKSEKTRGDSKMAEILSKGEGLRQLAYVHNDILQGNRSQNWPPNPGNAIEAAVRLYCLAAPSFGTSIRLASEGYSLALSQAAPETTTMKAPGWGQFLSGTISNIYNRFPSFKDPFTFPTAGAAQLSGPPPPQPEIEGEDDRAMLHSLDNSGSDEQGLSAFFELNAATYKVSAYSEPVRNVMVAIETLTDSSYQIILLAQAIDPSHILHSEHEAHGHHIDVAAKTLKGIIHQWIAKEILGSTVFDFLINQLIAPNPSVTPNPASFNTLLSNKIDGFFKAVPSAETVFLKRYIADNIIAHQFPLFLAPAQFTGDKPPIQWGMAFAGLSFAARLDKDTRDYNFEQANALGLLLYGFLEEKALPAILMSLFSLPAIIAYHQHAPDEVRLWSPATSLSIENKALAFFFEQWDIFDRENDPQLIFQNSLAEFKTRPEIDANSGGFTSEELDQAFAEQNQRIARNYYTAVKVLLNIAFHSFDPEELSFLLAAEINIGKFALVQQRNIGSKNGIVPAFSRNPDRVTVLDCPSNVDIVRACKSPQEFRIYAVVALEGQFRLSRVDERVEAYQALLPDTDWQQYGTDFRLEFNFKDENTSSSEPRLMPRISLPLIEKLAGMHEKILRDKLQTMGYGLTGLEQGREFILSLIPFYVCADSVENKRGGEAVFSCGIDALGAIPFIGSLVKTTSSIGKTLSKASVVAGHHAMIKALAAKGAQNAGKQAFKTAVRDFSVGSKQIAHEMSKVMLIKRGVSASRGAGRGVGRTLKMDSIAIKQTLEVGKHVQGSIPGLQSALVKLNSNNFISMRYPHVGKASAGVSYMPYEGNHLLAMEAGGSNFDFYSSARTSPATIASNPHLEWKAFTEFMPLYKHKKLSVEGSADFINRHIEQALHNRRYLTITGLKPTAKQIKQFAPHPYMLEAQSAASQAVDDAFASLSDARLFLIRVHKDPNQSVQAHKYFERAFGMPNEGITTAALIRMENIVLNSLTLKNSIKKNMIIASTKRDMSADGTYVTTLAHNEMQEGIVAFCATGDPKNRMVVIADRFFHSSKSAPIKEQTVLHEVSHLSAATDDTVYVNLSMTEMWDEAQMLTIFDIMAQKKRLKLDLLKDKIRVYRGVPPDCPIDDNMIYNALGTDAYFKANALMLNADHVAKYIHDLANMERRAAGTAVRVRRQATDHSVANILTDKILKQIIINIISEQ